MRITIRAIKNDNRKWVLVEETGKLVEEGYEHETKREAIHTATKLFPMNSVWEGTKVKDGWEIKID